MAKKNSQYEAMFLLGTVAGSAEDVTAMPRQIIERHGGQIILIKKWDERKLSYEIAPSSPGRSAMSMKTIAPASNSPPAARGSASAA